MKIVELPSKIENGKENMLEVLDLLRKAVIEGEIVAFVAVGIAPNDETLMWCGSQTHVTRLRMLGAIANLQHWYAQGE